MVALEPKELCYTWRRYTGTVSAGEKGSGTVGRIQGSITTFGSPDDNNEKRNMDYFVELAKALTLNY